MHPESTVHASTPLVTVHNFAGPVGFQPDAVLQVECFNESYARLQDEQADVNTEAKRATDPAAPEEFSSGPWTRRLLKLGLKSRIYLACQQTIMCREPVEEVLRLINDSRRVIKDA